jgi:hypothetical protein
MINEIKYFHIPPGAMNSFTLAGGSPRPEKRVAISDEKTVL